MFHMEFEQEEDGRWVAEVPELPGVMAYGADQEAARREAITLALCVLADRIRCGEPLPEKVSRLFNTA